MPKLNAIVENLDDVPETLRELYTERKDEDGAVQFTLNLADDIRDHPDITSLSKALTTLRTEIKDLKTAKGELETSAGRVPEDFDVEQWDRLKGVEKELAELKDKGGLDEEGKKAHELEIASYKKTHEQALEKATAQVEKIKADAEANIKTLKSTINSMVMEDGLSRKLAEHGVKKDFLPFVQAKLRDSALVVEDEKGRPSLAFETDLGQVPADEYISKWVTDDIAKPFIEQPTGGGSVGGIRKGVHGEENPWTNDNWNMARQGDIMRADRARADRLARAAGHPKGASGALKMDAK